MARGVVDDHLCLLRGRHLNGVRSRRDAVGRLVDRLDAVGAARTVACDIDLPALLGGYVGLGGCYLGIACDADLSSGDLRQCFEELIHIAGRYGALVYRQVV